MASEHLDRAVSTSKRKAILDRDYYRCQVCGAKGYEIGGYTPLQVHHIEDDPEHCSPGAPANLITLCKMDHNLIHTRMTRADVSTELSDEAAGERLERDYQILKLLEEDGLQRTKQIQTRIGRDPSLQTVKDRLWKLMGLDNSVPTQDRQIIDRDAVTGKWGLPADITTSERGRIPDDTGELNRRIEDERIRRMLDRGISRSTVADSFGVTARTTRYKQHRARAYEFPLDEIKTFENDEPIADGDTTPEQLANERDREAIDKGADTPTTDGIDAPVEILDDEDPLTPDEKQFEEPDAGDGDEDDYRRLLLTVGLEQLDQDAIHRYCIKREKSLSNVIEEWIQQSAAEVAD